jgi:TPR repeat protein
MIEFLEADDNGTQLSAFSGVDDRFRAIFDSVYDGIFISDPKTSRFIEINESGCRMFGYERAELMSGNIGTLSSGVHLYTADLALQHAESGSNMKPRIASLAAGSLLAFALFGAATAGPLEDGKAAYGRGDYAAAMRLLRSPAANGSADAQRDTALMYAQGQGVQQDFAQALIWFRKAAGQGDDLAQYFLGVMYRDGNGVPQDKPQALAWYRKSADQGFALAQFDIGSMYRHGEGVPKDAAQAAAWYRKAADQGYAFAQSNLGVMYSQGDGVPKDDAQAMIWFRKAADQGEAVALFNLGLAYDKGEGVPQDSAQAAVWYRKAADKGDVFSQINLGSMYTRGEGVPKDNVLAYMWADLAAAGAQDDETRELANKNRDNLVQGMSPEQIAAARRLTRAWKPAD